MTVHRILTNLVVDGIVDRVSRGTAHLPSSQRYHLTARGVEETADCLGFETPSELVRAYPMSKEWLTLLICRMDAVAPSTDSLPPCPAVQMGHGLFPERKAFIRNFVEGIEVLGDEGTLTYMISMPIDGATSESASVLDFVKSGPRWRIFSQLTAVLMRRRRRGESSSRLFGQMSSISVAQAGQNVDSFKQMYAAWPGVSVWPAPLKSSARLESPRIGVKRLAPQPLRMAAVPYHAAPACPPR